MSLTPQILPQELLDLFIDSIPLHSTDGHKTLRTCLLVSKAFFLRSRSRLFKHTTIDLHRVKRTNALWSLLHVDTTSCGMADYPNLASCIKSLKIIWPLYAFTISPQGPNSLGGMGHGYAFTETISLLAKTRTLQSLELFFESHARFSRLCAATDIYRSIGDIIHSPCLDTLRLSNLWNVPGWFVNIWKLKHLYVKNVNFLPDSDESDAPDADSSQRLTSTLPAHPVPQLRTFTNLYRPPFPQKWIHNTPNHPSPFSNLTTLFVVPRHNDPGPSFGKVLMLSATTLHTLGMRFSGHPRTHSQSFPIHALQSLTSLCDLRLIIPATFRVPDDSPGGYTSGCDYFDGTPEVVHILTNYKTIPSTLKHLTIILLSFSEYGMDIGFGSEQEWQSLGDVLMQERFQGLGVEVKLAVYFNYEKFEEEEEEEEEEEQVPFLRDFPRAWRERYPGIRLVVETAHAVPDDFLV